MLTLLEAAKLVQNPLQRGVIEIFPRTSPVLERLPFFEVNGQAYKYNQEETLPGIAFRAINASYTADVGVVNPAVEALYIMGGLSTTDRALIATQGRINDLRAIYDGMKSKACALEFTKKFFTGDNAADPNEFDGLETRLAGDQKVAMGSTSGGDALTLAKLDILMDSISGAPDVLFMNKALRRKVNSLVRAANQASETVTDAFGRMLTAYANCPIGVIEEDKDGNAILPFTESNPGGGVAASSSIYAVRFGAAEYVSGLQAGNMAVLDQGLTGTAYTTLIEWICGLGVFHPKAAARLHGIKNA